MASRPIPGFLPRSSALVLAVLAGTACYGFAGGGLPPEIETVAVLPFDNTTTDPTIAAEVNNAVRQALEQRLGLRQAGEQQADAVVTGRVSRYEPDLPVSFQGTPNNQVDVTQRLVQMVVDVSIMNRVTGRPIWEQRGIRVEGNYATGREREGRLLALEKLQTTIIEGAQSQW